MSAERRATSATGRSNHDRVWTVGANFYIGPHLVLKADYQWFQENTNFTRFDLGLGVAF